MNIAKSLVSLTVLVLIIAIVIVTGVFLFVDPNKLKPVLIKEVHKETGYVLSFKGKVSWSIYPKLMISFDQVTIRESNQSKEDALKLHKVKLAMPYTQLWQLNKDSLNNIKVGKVSYRTMEAENARLNLRRRNHMLTLQVEADYYGGMLQGIVSVNDLQGKAHWNYDIQLRRVALQPFLTAINPKSIKLAGVGDLRLQATSVGKNQKTIIENLAGIGEFSLHEGAVQGIDLNFLVASANALIDKEAVVTPGTLHTEFRNLKGNVEIQQGILATKDLLLTAPALTAMGQGNIDLVNHRLDYVLQVAPASKKGKWMIPILISGRLNKPKVRLDMLTLKTMIARTELDDLKVRITSQLKQLPDKADRFLEKLQSNISKR